MRHALLFVAVFLVSVTASAQMMKIGGYEFGYVYAGPKVGLGFSKISNADKSFGGDVKYRTGMELGLVGKFGITDRLAIQPEVTFLQRGVKTENNGFEGKYKVSYLSIPILAKYTLKAFGFGKIHLTGGVYSSVRTGGEVEYKDAAGGTYSENLDNSGWRRMDYGMTVGAGAEWPRKYGTWVFDLRYDYSVVDVHSSDNTYNSNRTIGVSVTYLYDFVDLYYRIKNKKKQHQESAPATGN